MSKLFPPYIYHPLQVFSSSLLMKTSCLRLKLVELNFLVSFNTDDQSKTDVANAINVITYCEQLQVVHPKSIPRYKYLSASGVRVFANAVRFGLNLYVKDRWCMYGQLAIFLLPTFKGQLGDWSPYYRVSCGSDWPSSIRYWSSMVRIFGLNLGRCSCNTASRVATFLST